MNRRKFVLLLLIITFSGGLFFIFSFDALFSKVELSQELLPVRHEVPQKEAETFKIVPQKIQKPKQKKVAQPVVILPTSAPLKVDASDESEDFITITWAQVNGAHFYALYRADTFNGDYKQIQEKITTNSYQDRNVISGKYYYYKVRAFNPKASPSSLYDRGFVALKPPRNLRATDASKNDIIITWEQNDEDISYDLYRSDQKRVGFKRIAKALTGESFRDTRIDAAKLYYYKIQAIKKGFRSFFSEADTGYVGVRIPRHFRASDGASPYDIRLSWSPENVDSYTIYRAAQFAGPYKVIAKNVKMPFFRDETINYCRNYYYKIQAVKNELVSKLSAWESGYGKCGAFVESFAGSGILGNQDAKNRLKATYNRPTGIVCSRGALYIADTFNHRIRKISETGETYTIAGGDSVGIQDGTHDIASFYRPTGIVVDSQENIYVSEVDNHLIRKITPQGAVSIFAGKGESGDKDGKAKEALFSHPYGLAIDKSDNLYVTELGNSKIRKITPQGEVSTLAGNGIRGKRDGSFLYARFDEPRGIVVDSEGTIFVSDSNNNTIRMLKKGRVVSWAGSSQAGDRDGKGGSASFFNPKGIALDKKGNLYVADTGNHKIRMITREGLVKTIAGSLRSGDKDGFESDAAFFSPRGITIDAKGTIYITDFHAHKIRKITILSR